MEMDDTARERLRQITARIGAQAVEDELAGNGVVEIVLTVRGRELRTMADSETIHRIVSLLIGEA